MAFDFEKNSQQGSLPASLKSKEEKQLVTLVDRDQTDGIVTADEADELRALAHQGRLIAYRALEGGAFGGYISKDEWEQLSTEPQALSTEVHLMNPTWGAGQSKVSLGELGPCFDRKEIVTLVDHLEANGIQMDNIHYDEKERTVMGDVKTAQGKFHVRVKLDDGTHQPPVYDFVDQEGQVAHVRDDQLKEVKEIKQSIDFKIFL